MSPLDQQRPGSSTAVLSIVDGVAPPDFVSLCWKVFFTSRGRGVSMNTHFPWLAIPGEACHVIMTFGADVVAGCTLRWIRDAKNGRAGGAIGLVCVDENHRGKGYSTQVLERAIAHARKLGLADVVLWTSKPGIYERFGFKSADNAVYGHVSAHPQLPSGTTPIRVPWPDVAEARGLPPFAMQAWRWHLGDTSAIVILDAQGAILAEWSGEEEAVVNLLEQAMPATWRINALQGDALLATLNRRGYATALQPSNLRMILRLDSDSSLETDYQLRVLDRI